MKLDDSPHANRIRAAAVSWGLLDVLTDDDPRMTLDRAKAFCDPNPKPVTRVSPPHPAAPWVSSGRSA